MNRVLSSAAAFGVALSLLSAGCSKETKSEGAPASSAQPAAAAPATPGGDPPKDGNHPLFHPEKATETAPDQYKVKFETTKGDFVVEVHRDWAPLGADRFYNLVKLGFYDGVKFFRAVDGFMVQFGINGDGRVNGKWMSADIKDDPPKQSNKRGFITFAMAGKDSRTTQVFINYSDANVRLDSGGFAPFGQVVDGMNVVDSLYKGYGEGAPRGRGPDQGRIQSEGNAYLEKSFPLLDGVKTAKVL
jgi:peptidyl-prolyl cis-trans isomerase A (cyclophilin A)